MKDLMRGVVCAVALLSGAATYAEDIVIVVSPQQSGEEARREATSILQFAASLEPGDQAILMDGLSLKTLGTFKVPSGAAYANPKARLNANRPSVSALLKVAGGAQGTGKAVLLPQLLRHVATTYANSKALEVIVFASPYYVDPNEPAFSMMDGLIPGDGHLNVSRAKSPYGTSDDPKALSTLRVHIGYSDQAMVPTNQQFFVERFWALFLARQGGTLVTFAADPAAVFQRARTHAEPPTRNYTVDPTTKLEMIRLRPASTTQRPLYEEPLSTVPVPPSELQRATNVEIGITWDCPSCDLDLYAKPGHGETLYFHHTASTEGIHVKDFLQSPRALNGYETVIFRVPIDMRALKIAINFYGGAAPSGVNGEVRVKINGQVYGMNFRVPASLGNGGLGVKESIEANQPGQPQTVLLDPQVILKLRPSNAS